MGTWKMIKGKVSQTIEDIKSSKSSSHTTMTPPVYPTVVIKGGHQTPAIDFDSDQETKTSVSEDLSLEHDRRSSAGSSKQKISSKLEDSDTDFENEILLEGETEHSRLRRGLANLKSKVKAKHEAHQAKKATLSTTVGCNPASMRCSIKKDISPSRSTGSSSSSTSLRGTFLRRRRNKNVEQGELISPTNFSPISALAATVISGDMTVPVVVNPKSFKSKTMHREVSYKKDIEIESGVEMLEDMIPPAGSLGTSRTHVTDDSGTSETFLANRDALDLPISQISFNSESPSDTMKLLYDNSATQSVMSKTSNLIQNGEADFRRTMLEILLRVRNLPILSFAGLIVILLLPIHDFIRGIFCCLLGITIVESVWNFIHGMIEYYVITIKPERKTFHIPNYSKMSICEVPAVEEFKTVKSYECWMNEIDSYDPNNFHLSMTRSVHIKLDGSILHLSNTNARIPKRSMWNEPPIDRSTIVFTTHRTYNLLGCRIELLPIGLAKKRFFNRKYPIQLIVKVSMENKSTAGTPDPPKTSTMKHRKLSRHKLSKHEKQEAKETIDNKLSQTETIKTEAEIDFGATIMNADLQKLQDDVNPDEDLTNITVPCGDEVRILLFSRCAREKEDWYRRFVAASLGHVHDQDLHLNNVKLIDDKGLQAAATKAAQQLTNPKPKDTSTSASKPAPPVLEHQLTSEEFLDIPSLKDETETDYEMVDVMPDDADNIEGLLMTSGAARNDPDYVKFMAYFQNACSQSRIPVYRGPALQGPTRHNKRTLRHENELWKGIDQSLFLGPSGSVVWANVLMGRVLFSALQNDKILAKLQHVLQMKLNSIKLPSFMEDVIIKNIDLGNKPPLVHRVSQPVLDERGIWLDMDVTYEGLCHITVTTKLNLLRLKRPARPTVYMSETSLNMQSAQMSTAQYSTLLNNDMTASVMTAGGASSIGSAGGFSGASVAGSNCGLGGGASSTAGIGMGGVSTSSTTTTGASGSRISDDELCPLDESFSNCAIFDSDAESTGSSSTESDNSATGTLGENPNSVMEGTSSNPGNARRIFKFVDRIATSNFFQYAAELSYVQKAMENMSTTITLGIDLHGLVSRVTLNIPPPPSDRLWLAFRAPPRLWLTARPTVGDKSVDWSIVTNIIEGKLCEAVNKYLVYPNMVDLTIPVLGKHTASE